MITSSSYRPGPLPAAPGFHGNRSRAALPKTPHFGGNEPASPSNSQTSRISNIPRHRFQQSLTIRDWERSHTEFLNAMHKADLPSLLRILKKQSSVVRQSSLFNTAEDIVNQTALHFLASGRFVQSERSFEALRDIIRLCKNFGADFNAQDCFGRTPLMWASLYGNVTLANLLLENGAKAQEEDHEGHTASDYARINPSSAAQELSVWLKQYEQNSP
jgi:hypothetical protein